MNIAIIPARGGSRRIPRKNIRNFEGQPIIAYSIGTAQAAGCFHRIVVTTDDAEIAAIARRYGADAIDRPKGQEQDDIGTQAVAKGACKQMALGDEDLVCVIYATAPLMRIADIHRGLLAITMAEWKPDYAFSVNTDPLEDAGQFYWGRAGSFLAGKRLVSEHSRMIPIPSMHVCDINTEEDWQWAVHQYRNLTKRGKLQGKPLPIGPARKGASTMPARP